jgi:hypothetical protein
VGKNWKRRSTSAQLEVGSSTEEVGQGTGAMMGHSCGGQWRGGRWPGAMRCCAAREGAGEATKWAGPGFCN